MAENLKGGKNSWRTQYKEPTSTQVSTKLLVLLVAQKEEEAKEGMAREEVEQEDQVDNQQALKRTKS